MIPISWRQWTPSTRVACDGTIAFDTETGSIEAGSIPTPVVLTFSTGSEYYAVEPANIPAWVEMVCRMGCRLVAHNFAFDSYVINQLLNTQERRKWRMVVNNRLAWDTMIMDFLVRLANGLEEGPLRGRSLAAVCEEHLQVQLDKTLQNSWTQFVGHSIREIPPHFLQYAVADAVYTRQVFDEIYPQLTHLSRHYGWQNEQWGPLTHHIQLKGSLALHDSSIRGIRVDQVSRAEVGDTLKLSIQDNVTWILEYYPTVFQKDKVKKREGMLLVNPTTGVPQINLVALRNLLQGVVTEKKLKAPPRTEKSGEITTSADYWQKVDHPLVTHWLEMTSCAKLLIFVDQVAGESVHPSYQTLVRTGRTSCAGPNLQQMPRHDWFRKLFVPSPGTVFVIADYNALELRCLAAVCVKKYGHSALADTFREGVDPHCRTAASLLGKSYTDFMDLKKTDRKLYDRWRQSAKAVNFGVPGGLGAKSLREYAQENYGVTISMEEARAFKATLINEVYPELAVYLEQNPAYNLASNLETSVEALCECFDLQLESPAFFSISLILAGKPGNYSGAFSRHIWKCLEKLNRDALLEMQIRNKEGSPSLHRRLLGSTVVTLTGRVRGGVEYTESCNTQFQGLAADGAKLALYEVARSYPVVAFVHDELVVEVPVEGAEEHKGHIVSTMETQMDRVLGDYVGSVVDAVVSPYWRKV